MLWSFSVLFCHLFDVGLNHWIDSTVYEGIITWSSKSFRPHGLRCAGVSTRSWSLIAGSVTASQRCFLPGEVTDDCHQIQGKGLVEEPGMEPETGRGTWRFYVLPHCTSGYPTCVFHHPLAPSSLENSPPVLPKELLCLFYLLSLFIFSSIPCLPLLPAWETPPIL